MSSSYEFQFRVWLYEEDGDAPEAEVWYHGFEKIEPYYREISDWVREALQEEQLHELFKLDRNLDHQVIGRATISCSYDSYSGEYDQDLVIDEFQAQVFNRPLLGLFPDPNHNDNSHEESE